jgi:hypothetical protein
LFDLKSNYEFMSTVDDETWCMNINKDTFIEICEGFPKIHAYMMQRALMRRNYFKLMDLKRSKKSLHDAHKGAEMEN